MKLTYSLDEIIDTVIRYTDEWSEPVIKLKKLKQEIDSPSPDVVGDDGLKSCPFCGGNAKLIGHDEVYMIECTGCNLQTRFFWRKGDEIDYWNHRV